MNNKLITGVTLTLENQEQTQGIELSNNIIIT